MSSIHDSSDMDFYVMCEVLTDCKGKPENHCPKCDKKMCVKCTEYHNSYHDDHEVNYVYYEHFEISSACKHTEQMEGYCTKCETPTCNVCQGIHHYGHWVEPVDNVAENTKALYEKMRDDSSGGYATRIQERLDKHDEKYQKTSKEISEFAEGLKIDLDRKKGTIMKQLDVETGRKRAYFEQQLASRNQQQEVLRQVPRLVQLQPDQAPLIWIAQRQLIQSTLDMARDRQGPFQDEHYEDSGESVFIPNEEIAPDIERISLGSYHNSDDAITTEEDTLSSASVPHSEITKPVYSRRRKPSVSGVNTPRPNTMVDPDQTFEKAVLREGTFFRRTYSAAHRGRSAHRHSQQLIDNKELSGDVYDDTLNTEINTTNSSARERLAPPRNSSVQSGEDMREEYYTDISNLSD